MKDERDLDLERRFETLRRADDLGAPGFRRTFDRAKAAADAGAARPRRSVLQSRPAAAPLALALALVLFLALAAGLLTRSAGHPPRGGTPAPAAIASWTSPTASLLETPGRDLFSSLPSVVDPLPAWATEGASVRRQAPASFTPVQKGTTS